MNKTKREKTWARWAVCVGVMFVVFALSVFARDAAIDAGIDALEKLADDLDQRLKDAINNEDYSGARGLLRKWTNLIRILVVLRDEQRKIVFGGVTEANALAQVHYRDGSIHLREILRERDPRVIAQHLAHEAAHLSHPDKKRTLDGEMLAWQKEGEVWTEFIRKAYREGEPTLRDNFCHAVLIEVIKGEAHLRGFLRRRYPDLDRNDNEQNEGENEYQQDR